ncbi:hypothetical protein DRO32_00595 [Candidatus Bathyarchaeota archaeon]|nr:MAG: hypothetical protein DRO32_00595 [Candidatus Bathyarchaeota archaeon]
MEEVARRLISRFMPDPFGTRYAILRADGSLLASDLMRSEEDRVRRAVVSLGEILKPDEFTFLGGREESFLILRASEDFFIVIRASKAAPGIMVSCARAMYRELREQLEAVKPEGAPGEALPTEEALPPEGEVLYELDPRFGSVDEALDTLPPSLIARNIVANLDRPLTARQIAEGLKSIGIEVPFEEVLRTLSYLEALRIIRRIAGPP